MIRPIIFSAPMIRALLNRRKTQTRRAIDQPRYDFDVEPVTHRFGLDWRKVPGPDSTRPHERCPVGRISGIRYAVGDRLWVKEAFRFSFCHDSKRPAELQGKPIAYEAGRADLMHPGRARAPIHMPRWASRLTLTVADVRVQRLQEISDGDAEAEGARPAFSDTADRDAPVCSHPSYRWGFPELWNSIHGPDAWDRNDWVAAYTFSVEHRNIDQ